MAKTCQHNECSNPIWSKKLCKWHQPFKTNSIPLKRTPIKKVSDKRVAQKKVYSVLRETFLKQHPNCEVFPHLKSNQVHHKKHREGERLNDTTYWMAVSQEGHDYVHANPSESYEKGWLIKG